MDDKGRRPVGALPRLPGTARSGLLFIVSRTELTVPRHEPRRRRRRHHTAAAGTQSGKHLKIFIAKRAKRCTPPHPPALRGENVLSIFHLELADSAWEDVCMFSAQVNGR